MPYHRASRFLVKSVWGALATVIVCGPIGAFDEPEKDKAEQTQADQNLKNMQRAAAQYVLSTPAPSKQPFKLRETAIMRTSNPITSTTDGALFVWTDHGRPQALLKFFTFNNKTYSHAWLSLSDGIFSAERNGKVVWSPTEPGIKLQVLPGSPPPAETAAKRLRQMKTLAEKFSATYTAVHLAATPVELRFLNQPLLRYETDDDDQADGALFGYAQSTTPIGILLIESLPTKDGRSWHYAFSSLVTGPVTARYEDREVFSLERDRASTDPQLPFVLFRSVPIPKK
jgi:hypothetical protein